MLQCKLKNRGQIYGGYGGFEMEECNTTPLQVKCSTGLTNELPIKKLLQPWNCLYVFWKYVITKCCLFTGIISISLGS